MSLLSLLSLLAVTFWAGSGCAASADPAPFDPVLSLVEAASERSAESDSRRLLGLSFLRTGLYRMAWMELDSLRREFPEDPGVWLLLHDTLGRLGEVEASSAALARYSELRPGWIKRFGVPNFDEPDRRWRVVLDREYEAFLYPQRALHRARLASLLSGLGASWDRDRSGLLANGESWDSAVSDAATWAAAASILPDFPPPPGRP